MTSNHEISKYIYSIVMDELKQNNYSDLDKHRNKFLSSLNKIKNIVWVEVDSQKYNTVKNIV
jgi:hypothetical protein